MLIRSKAPLRLGLAGGGSDVAPYCDLYGGAVLNASINLSSFCTIEPVDDGTVTFIAYDRDEEFSAPCQERYAYDGLLDLHKGVYNRVVRDFNDGKPLSLKISTYSDAPAGSGLGSSSTMVVAILTAFAELLHLPLGEYDVAHLAFEIERQDIGLRGGAQDQYAATFGGVNFMEFHEKNRVIVNPLRIKKWILSELEASTVLYYTGVSRSSDKNNETTPTGAGNFASPGACPTGNGHYFFNFRVADLISQIAFCFPTAPQDLTKLTNISPEQGLFHLASILLQLVHRFDRLTGT